MRSDNQSEVLDEVINWNDFFGGFDTLQNTFLNVFDIEWKKFVYVQIPSANFLGTITSVLLSKGLQAWTERIFTADRKKCDEFLFEQRNYNGHNPQVLKHCLSYQIHHPTGYLISILHEQRILSKNGKLFIINFINDLTEKKKINEFIDKTVIDTNREFQFNIHEKKTIFVEISERERQVLRLIASGLSSREIADYLFISNHTAITHRKNLINKFHVSNTAELIKEASKVIWLG